MANMDRSIEHGEDWVSSGRGIGNNIQESNENNINLKFLHRIGDHVAEMDTQVELDLEKQRKSLAKSHQDEDDPKGANGNLQKQMGEQEHAQESLIGSVFAASRENTNIALVEQQSGPSTPPNLEEQRPTATWEGDEDTKDEEDIVNDRLEENGSVDIDGAEAQAEAAVDGQSSFYSAVQSIEDQKAGDDAEDAPSVENIVKSLATNQDSMVEGG